MYHGILKEDHVHASSPDAFVVMAQEHIQATFQTLKGLDGLVNLWQIKVCIFWLVPYLERTFNISVIKFCIIFY